MSKTVEFNVFRGTESGGIFADTTRRTLGPFDVFVEITHAGLCGTDRLFKTKGIALGHEGAGVVRDTGDAVTSVKKGDRVGFGWIQKVCGHCNYCISDRDQYCDQREQYGTHDFEIGSFASHAVWNESMLIKLPDLLEAQYAAPLMCGGATVWGAMTSYDLKAGDRVAISGIGGLGHMAIQFASRLGCNVVVLSSNPTKREEAMGLGAHEFHVTKDGAPENPIKQVNHLFWCGNQHPDFSKLIPLVACGGSIYPLTVSFEPSVVPIQPLVANGIRIQGSAVASRGSIRRMLDFVSLHGMRPIIMTWPLNKDGIESAFKVLEEGRMRYRGVLVSERHLTGRSVAEKK
ncbi:hypothetical protein VTN00DRAFT_3263 [Thermoascus crustaceus]|uniref:uncharacterized protein n=1 Tax=Thermoascus crustaceus TaxID=5088 RepID=UPI0037429678